MSHSLPQLLEHHLAASDELHRLALEENQRLQRERIAPDETAREKKRAAAARLDATLMELRALSLPPGSHGGALLERARERTLQILHLERQNEQLLLRHSFAGPRAAPPVPSAVAALKFYEKLTHG